jgi:hypothetical protein
MATPTNLPATFVAGNVLTAAQQNGLRGAFRVLQLVAANYTVQTGSTSATYATTGLSATITPQATTNTILVNISIPIGLDAAADNICGIRLIRTTGGVNTTVGTWDYALATGNGTRSTYGSWSNCINVSPATTSATTFTVQFARFAGSGNVYVQTAGLASNIVLQEISA